MESILRNLQNEIQEYESLLEPINSQSHEKVDWGGIETKLIQDCEWTPEGAQVLTTLVRQYGSFVLKNALALSVALNIEDGELGL